MPFEDESCHAVHRAPILLDRCLREHGHDPRAMRVADPDLVPVEDPPRAVGRAQGAGLDVRCVRSVLGLGERERRERLAASAGGKPAPLLLLGPVQPDPLDADRQMGSEEDRQASVARGDTPGHAVRLSLGEAHAPVFFGYVEPEDPTLGETLEHALGDGRVTIEGGTIDLGVEEPLEVVQIAGEIRRFAGGKLGERKDEIGGDHAAEEGLGVRRKLSGRRFWLLRGAGRGLHRAPIRCPTLPDTPSRTMRRVHPRGRSPCRIHCLPRFAPPGRSDRRRVTCSRTPTIC